MWERGIVNGYLFDAKVFETGSQFGINGGRISKLHVTNADETKCIINYDRGWDIEPKEPYEIDILNAILKFYECKGEA